MFFTAPLLGCGSLTADVCYFYIRLIFCRYLMRFKPCVLVFMQPPPLIEPIFAFFKRSVLQGKLNFHLPCLQSSAEIDSHHQLWYYLVENPMKTVLEMISLQKASQDLLAAAWSPEQYQLCLIKLSYQLLAPGESSSASAFS